jgi:Fungal trichothecene efflux pump (TRI12)
MTFMAAMNPNNPGAAVALSTLAGFGVGCVLIPIATVAMSVTPDAYIATVVALANALRFLGGSIGYGIYYAIFSGKIEEKLLAYVAKYALMAGLPLESAMAFVGAFLTDPTKAALVTGVTPEILEAAAMGLRWAYTDSLKHVWYSSLPFGILCIIGCIVMEKNDRFITNRVAAVSEDEHCLTDD